LVDGIFFGYASHSREYHVLNLETNHIVETCEVTFDETQPRSQLVFEYASDDELGEEIFQEEQHEHGDDEDGGVVPQLSMYLLFRQAVKPIFRYLRHTPDFGMWYSASSSLALHGFSDVDFAGCRLDRKSTFGTWQFLGSSLVSWSSRKQSSVAQSNTEEEYVAELVVALTSFGSHTP
jgi:hypothetical protein